MSDWLPETLLEVQLILEGRLCDDRRQRQCRTEDQEFSDWACTHCREYRRPEGISAWSWHLLLFFQLQEAGYPLRANDLSLETWLILGLLRRWRQSGKEGLHHEKSEIQQYCGHFRGNRDPGAAGELAGF